MKTIEEMMEQIGIEPIEANSVHWVNILHINDPHDFYVRLTKFSPIAQKIEQTNPTRKPSRINSHQIVLFNLNTYDTTMKIARGLILRIEKDPTSTKYDIFAIDYGNVERGVGIDRIWSCDPSLSSIPNLAIECRLGHCAHKGQDWGEAVNAFKYYARQGECAKMVVEGRMSGKLIVTLHNACPNDIATLLALTEFTTLGYVPNAVNKLRPWLGVTRFSVKQYYKFKELKANVAIRVRVLSGLSFDEFYVAEVNDSHLYSRNMLTFHVKGLPTLKEDEIKKEDPVLVKETIDIYVRGIIKEVLDSNKGIYLVFLVDIGRNEIVYLVNMRTMPTHCLSAPVMSIYCTGEVDTAMNVSHMLVYGNEFNITITEIGDGFDFPNVVEVSKI